eukprot:TRINITY_DN30315_c0_g1_i1.p1 TRINITY_DN30315_c0_g1~~TRINITY_DN30315_c0_g1_i1.p1  ORF type:complete len:843 (+),score=303.44 TRINITY_DN30315_c0_g1_i1:86-2530(+)
MSAQGAGSPQSSRETVAITKGELARLHSRQEELLRNVTQLAEQNQSLSEELDRLTQTVVSLQVSRQQEGESDGKKKSRLDEMRDKLKSKKEASELQAENDVLRAKLAAAGAEGVRAAALQLNVQVLQESNREHAEARGQLQARCRELERAQAELERFRAAVERDRPDAGGFAAAQERIAALEPVAQRAEEAERAAAELREEADALRTRLAELEAQWTGRMQEQHRLAGENAALDKQLHQKELAARDQEVRQLRERCAELSESLSAAQGAGQMLAGQLSGKDAELQQAQRDLEAYGEQCRALTDKLKALGETECSLRETQQSLARVAQVQEERDLERQLRQQADSRAQELGEEVQRLQKEVAEAQLHQGMEAGLRKTIEHQRQNIESLKEAVRMRDDDIRQMRGAQEELAKLQERLTAVEQERDEAVRVHAEAEQSWQESRARAEAEAQAAAEAAAAQSEALRGELADAQRELEIFRAQQQEFARLRAEVQQFDQRLEDQEGEHRIQMRKKEGLIRELQRDLAAAATAAEQLRQQAPPNSPDRTPPRVSPRSCERQPLTPSGAEGSPAVSPRAAPPDSRASTDGLSPPQPQPHQQQPTQGTSRRRQSAGAQRAGGGGAAAPALRPAPSSLLMQCAAGGAASPTPGGGDLEEENLALIQRVAALQQDKWRLDERVAYLEEDNEKKRCILEHWVSGPAAAQLAHDVGNGLLRPVKRGGHHGHGWKSTFGLGGSPRGPGKAVVREVRDTTQQVLQDALADNIRLGRELDEAQAEAGRLRSALAAAGQQQTPTGTTPAASLGTESPPVPAAAAPPAEAE